MFKIEYSKCKTDRWGHFLPSPPARFELKETLAEALESAKAISTKYKTYDVNVLDLNGPSDEPEDISGMTVWCVASYKRGHCTCINDYYKKTCL